MHSGLNRSLAIFDMEYQSKQIFKISHKIEKLLSNRKNVHLRLSDLVDEKKNGYQSA